MHDPIKYVLSHIFQNIPHEILTEAFIPKNKQIVNTVDYYIQQDIIEKKVLLDCNLFAGKKKNILLTQEMLEMTNLPVNYSILSSANIGLYRIPPHAREYTDLSHVIELRYPYSASGYAGVNFPAMANFGQTVTSKGMDILNSHTFANTDNPPRPVLLTNNLVKLDPPQFNHIDYLLVCILKYNNRFTNLNPDAIRPLAELALSATKAYIYNKLIIYLNKVAIEGGQEIGRFKEMVEKYESEAERYN
jgi:hypothetical protein